jgi:hypothetical protein
MNRRSFLRHSTLAGTALALAGDAIAAPAHPPTNGSTALCAGRS